MSSTPKPDPQPQGDPYTEPANSTVGDWHGQEVDADTEAAERALAVAGGDESKAEELFERVRPEHESDAVKVPEEQRPAIGGASGLGDVPPEHRVGGAQDAAIASNEVHA